MNQIHTSYKVSKMLKEFLGKSAPEPMDSQYYGKPTDWDGGPTLTERNGRISIEWTPAYQLHDLLSKPFCEAMAKKTRKKCAIKFSVSHLGWLYSIDIHGKYWNGGMEAVEKTLTEMMEGK